MSRKSCIIFAGYISLFIISAFIEGIQSEDPIVTTGEGKLKGIVQKSRNGRNYFGFLGVHYAAQPKRFEIAGPPVAWEGVRDADKFGAMCPQFFFPTADFIGDENCLVNNIYTPELTGKKPVLVFIHGGAFIFGITDGYGAKYFMDQDVVLVTMNYRLGILGFLTTEDEEIQGNFGLKDQVESLKWIQRNIANFGGDPDKVTIFGESAGGASVNYHLLSPLSRGLFSRAISQSASVLNPWALQRNPIANAKKLAEIFDCPLKKGRKGSRALKTCLQSKTTKEIVDSQKQFIKLISGDPICPFAPTIEKVSESNGTAAPIFLQDLPYQLLTDEKLKHKLNLDVPWIVGVTEDEGLLIHAGAILNDKSERGLKIRDSLNKDRAIIFPITLAYEDTVPNDKWEAVADNIYEYYFGDRLIGPDTPTETINMFSDRWFNHGVRNVAKLFARQGAQNVYLYIMTLKGKFSFSEFYGTTPGFKAVTHLDDLTYLFNMTFSTVNVPEFDGGEDSELLQFSKDVVQLWTSFANTGKPELVAATAEKWEPVSKDDEEPKWYILDKEKKLKDAPFNARMKFWDNVPHLMEMEKDANLQRKRDEL